MDITACPASCSLSSLDWKVVDLARRDGRRSILQPGRVERFVHALFGRPIALPLADHRLEALRRFCVRAWHWTLIRVEDTRLAVEAGYTTADPSEILSHIGRCRGVIPSIDRHNQSDRDWTAVAPCSLAYSPALPAPFFPSRRGQSPHQHVSLSR
jgi:hypothetical protein